MLGNIKIAAASACFNYFLRMENPKENIVDKIYKLRKNFVIIGLTGRTGSGCTTVAKILQTQHPEEFKTEYREINTDPINNDVRKIELSTDTF